MLNFMLKFLFGVEILTKHCRGVTFLLHPVGRWGLTGFSTIFAPCNHIQVSWTM